MIRDELEKAVTTAQNSIAAILQKFHNETGMIPVEINFQPLDVRTMEDFGKSKRVIISNVELRANT